MKSTPEYALWAFPLGLAAALLLAGCASHQDVHLIGNGPGPVYDTAEKIQAMPPCKGKVVERGPCFVYLRTADGSGFYIGSPAIGLEIGHFLHALKDGKRYKFPETFQKYQEQLRRAEN